MLGLVQVLGRVGDRVVSDMSSVRQSSMRKDSAD